MGALDFIKSIRTRLFIFFIFMGGLPFISLIVVGALNMESELEEHSRQTSLLRNSIISEHVTELVEKKHGSITFTCLDARSDKLRSKRRRILSGDGGENLSRN